MRDLDLVNPLEWGGKDAFTHSLIVGPTRCGKTATILKPIIYQILQAKRRGKEVGLSVVEPKGDVAFMVKEMCEEMEIPCVYINPDAENPDLNVYPSNCINVMNGSINDVAEATVAVLRGLFGKQEAFFATVQELATRNVTKLLKEVYGDNMDITDVLTNLRDEEMMKVNVAKLRAKNTNPELVGFFENELLDGDMKEHYRKLVVGLRAQMENLTSNAYLKDVITGKSDINLDEHFEKGGVLAVNTSLGRLGRSGDAFGQFIAMHLQLATFRRKGTESSRVPHYMIIDEYSRYINPDIERFLSISAEYRVAGIFALQSLGQIEIESGTLSAKAMKRAIMASCRNKIMFGGVGQEDAKEFMEEMGKDRFTVRQNTYGGNPFNASFFPKGYTNQEKEKHRILYTQLQDGLPPFHYVHRLLKNGMPQLPGIAKGVFIPRDWKQRVQKEQKREKGFWIWIGGKLEFYRNKLTESMKKDQDTLENPFEKIIEEYQEPEKTLTEEKIKKLLEQKQTSTVLTDSVSNNGSNQSIENQEAVFPVTESDWEEETVESIDFDMKVEQENHIPIAHWDEETLVDTDDKSLAQQKKNSEEFQKWLLENENKIKQQAETNQQPVAKQENKNSFLLSSVNYTRSNSKTNKKENSEAFTTESEDGNENKELSILEKDSFFN